MRGTVTMQGHEGHGYDAGLTMRSCTPSAMVTHALGDEGIKTRGDEWRRFARMTGRGPRGPELTRAGAGQELEKMKMSHAAQKQVAATRPAERGRPGGEGGLSVVQKLLSDAGEAAVGEPARLTWMAAGCRWRDREMASSVGRREQYPSHPAASLDDTDTWGRECRLDDKVTRICLRWRSRPDQGRGPGPCGGPASPGRSVPQTRAPHRRHWSTRSLNQAFAVGRRWRQSASESGRRRRKRRRSS